MERLTKKEEANVTKRNWNQSKPNVRCLTRLAIVVFLGMTLLSWPSTGSAAPASVDTVDRTHPRHKTLVKRRWGIETASVHRVAAGYLMVFRYKVIDAEKAKPVFLRRLKPRLIHERTGAYFIVPAPQKTGPLRNSNIPQEGRIYSMVFANPGGFVQPGDLVTIVIGDFEAKHLVVE